MLELERIRVSCGAAPACGNTPCLSWLDGGGSMNGERRRVIAAIGALGAAALVPGCAALREARERRAIDTHHHFYAPEYQKAWLDWEEKRSIPHFPQQVGWSPQRSIEEMDKAGVKTSILSLASTPGVCFDLPPAEA